MLKLLALPLFTLPLLNDWYVDGSAASCAAGTGTLALPFCTIQEAIAAASSGDTVFIADGVYTETMDLDKDLRIVGSGAGTEINGGFSRRGIFVRSGATAMVDGLLVTNCSTGFNGGGIQCLGDLTLRNSTITGNSSGFSYGGGINVMGSSARLAVFDSTISRNSNYYGGAGIHGRDALGVTVIRTTIFYNGTGDDGGGILVNNTPLLVDSSALISNYANNMGAIAAEGPITVINTTISQNASSDTAVLGFFDVAGSAASVLRNCTVTENFATSSNRGSGIFVATGVSVEIESSIVSMNSGFMASPDDISGALVSMGGNVFGTHDGTLVAGPGDQFGVDPLLESLGFNGGPTETHALSLQSPAIDAAAFGAAITVDQRGVLRPPGLADVGAYELGGFGQTVHCNAVPNSTGVPGRIFTQGSAEVSAAATTLVASALPPNVFGFYVVGTAVGFTANPGGSQGNLCVSGTIGRLSRNSLGEILPSGPGGQASLTVDLTQLPTPSGTESVMPGDTRIFQFWYRDANPLQTSNCTEAVEIHFL